MRFLAVSRIRRSTPEAGGERRVVPFVLGISYLAVATGNLALPETLRSALLADYLLVALGILLIFAVFHLGSMIDNTGRVLALLFFFTTLVPGALLTTGTAYNASKLQGLLIAAIVILTPLCLGSAGSRTFAVLAIGMVVVSVLYSVLLPRLGVESDTGRLSAFGLNPIGLARLTAVGAVAAFAALMTRRLGTWWTNVLALAVIALCMIASISTGSRGPVLAVVIACALMLIALVAGRRLNVWWLVALGLAVVLGFQLLSGDGSLGLDRILEGNDSGRGTLYADTLALIWAHPMGIGWGNLPGYLPGDNLGDADVLYPHNLFLEVAVEGGWLAFLAITILVVVVLVSTWNLARRSESVWHLILFGLVVYSLVNAQVSSDIVGNRMLWVALGFAIALVPHGRRKSRAEVLQSRHRVDPTMTDRFAEPDDARPGETSGNVGRGARGWRGWR